MSAKPSPQRPLSPFMIGPYYRPQLTSMLSITHRLTGMINVAGALGLVVWLLCIAAGPDAHAAFMGHAGAWYGLILMFGWSWTLAYHLCNGLRHLVWDTGRGFDLPTVYRTGYAVIAGSLALTALVWLVVLI
ncbi:succinate dehydrogenase, cytochrome b556 subunit [Algiphilus sp.]|uniref:succinate dehydrogenase, cytochrome b556 subunit n=1 Tax=Algiphilus sp. TaxID=1872431 RepID=UPI0025C41DF9|nr:succinate dehydrogenase, cytochrome b556 subunit [Algiphilus sp.]MCK5769745.1 succinate dehydrogenase, cytochrome b556 subunit [Algiphilus sp.]